MAQCTCFGVDDEGKNFIGVVLSLVFLILLGIIFWRYRTVLRRMQALRQLPIFSPDQLDLIERILSEDVKFETDASGEVVEYANPMLFKTSDQTGSPSNDTGKKRVGFVSVSREKNENRYLKRLLISSKDVMLQHRVGSGSYGDVYKGSFQGGPVAIKSLKTVDEKTIKAFRAEVLLHSVLHHPNVIALIGICTSSNLTGMLLEWAEHGSLEDFLVSGKGPIPAERITWTDPLLRMATDVAKAMAYLHSKKWFDETAGIFRECVIHRDLKPDNLLVTPTFAVKVTDFGLSRAIDREEIMTAVGTPLYAAPELFRTEHYDESCDVYSYGLCLLQFCLNEPLVQYFRKQFKQHFNAREAKWMDISRRIVLQHWRPSLSPEAPEKINNLILRCVDKDPRERPTFEEILKLLEGEILQEVVLSQKGRSSRPSVAGDNVRKSRWTRNFSIIRRRSMGTSLGDEVEMQAGFQSLRESFGRTKSDAVDGGAEDRTSAAKEAKKKLINSDGQVEDLV